MRDDLRARVRRGGIGFAILVLSAALAFARELPPTAKAEIDALLSRLETSGCQFYRNGIWHSGVEARAHLQSKLDYLLRQDPIASADEFIRKAATKSIVSGQAYKVACPGHEEEPSAVWFGDALREIRESGPVTHGR